MNNEEEKKYTIIGKVEIGTDEYRDLVENNIKLGQKLDEARSAKWKIEDELSRLKRIVSSQKEQLESLKYFIKDEKLEDRYKLYLFQQKQNEETEEDEDL